MKAKKMPNEKILVVEDDSIEAMDIQRTLESMGYEVPAVASSGEEAIKKTDEIKPDLVLMDIILKGKVNGIEAAAKIKKDSNIPIIYLTAHSEEPSVKRALVTEPYAYLLKPFDRTELKFTIDLALYKNKMEKSLCESEENFRAVSENANDGIFITTGDGRQVYANQKAAEITGYTIQELLNSKISDLAHPDEYEKLMNRYKQRIAGKPAPSTYETRILRKDNEIVPIELTAAKTLWKGQTADIVIIRDITERKKAELSLIESEKKYRKLFEEAVDGIALADIETGELIDVNQSLADLVERERSELIGQSQIIIHPEEDVDGKFSKTFTQHRLEKEGQFLEARVITKTGIIKYVEIKANKLELKGQKILQKIFSDITERKKAEEALQTSETILNDIIDQSPHPMWISDAHGTLIRINPACLDMLNILNEDVVGKYNIFKDNIVEEQGFIPLVKSVFEEGHTVRFEIIYDSSQLKHLTLKNFAFVILDVTIFPLKDAQGKVTNAVIQHMNITERKQAEEALQEREEFLSGTLNDMTTFVAILKMDGEIIFVNNTPLKLIEKSLEDVKGMMFYDVEWWTFSKETVEKLKQHIKLCASGERVRYETQVHTLNGLIWIDYSMHPIYDEKGNVKYLVAEGRDITEKKTAEKAFKDSEEKFRL
ncbi:MAG: PAS domain S-box protein, partial [Euryarchaeota archaeon]|nr:PAS domain S-box protein [Euryarchaeota archaeon]